MIGRGLQHPSRTDGGRVRLAMSRPREFIFYSLIGPEVFLQGLPTELKSEAAGLMPTCWYGVGQNLW